jgi:hygromycin-B 7''-O-kinase
LLGGFGSTLDGEAAMTADGVEPADEVVVQARQLGGLTRSQLQTALDRFDLGRLVSAAPATTGNWGQNCFVTSSTGEYVLRGRPFYAWQLLEEQFFARLLHERTETPVPWPYYVEQSAALFGWPYAIMARLPGEQLASLVKRGLLEMDAQQSLARHMGTTLAEMQKLEWAVSGAYAPGPDSAAGSIRQSTAYHPAAESLRLHGPPPNLDTSAYVRHYLARAMQVVPECTTAADQAWAESLIERSRDALTVPYTPCCVMVDFQENNVAAERAAPLDDWRISGVFDLMGMFFGDGEKALTRQTGGYLQRSEALARGFLEAYLAERPPRPGLRDRFPLYALAENLTVWIWAHEAGKVWWEPRLTLREWAGGAAGALDRLVPPGSSLP